MVNKMRSESASDSWNDSTIAEKRKKRYNVEATFNGVVATYRSMLAAMTDLKMDTKNHIKFRMLLKAQNELTIDNVTFRIVEKSDASN